MTFRRLRRGLRQNLGDMAALCWVLAASEEALASQGTEDRPPVPLRNIPGAAASSPLAAAWEQFWEAGERAERAAHVLRGHLGGPVRRGEQRQDRPGSSRCPCGHVGSVDHRPAVRSPCGIEEQLATRTASLVSRARAVAAAVTAVAVLAAGVPADAVPVPPAAWTPAAGLLIAALIVGDLGRGGQAPAATVQPAPPPRRRKGACPQ